MNWARVKTILIIVFLIVNIFLFFKVTERYSTKELRPAEISDLKNILASNNIVVETALPLQIKYLPRMKVTNHIVDENKTADEILGRNKWTVKKNGSGNAIYSSDNKELKFDGYGFVEYTIVVGKNNISELLTNKTKGKQAIRNILKEYIKLDKYVEDEAQIDKTGTRIDYSYYNDKSEIFNNNIVTKILPEGKIIIKHGRVDSNGFTSKGKKVTSVDALVEFVRVVKDEGRITIKQISIGYYADLNKGNEIVRFGEADPAWKIKTDKGTFVFDAYTGNLAASF